MLLMGTVGLATAFGATEAEQKSIASLKNLGTGIRVKSSPFGGVTHVDVTLKKYLAGAAPIQISDAGLVHLKGLTSTGTLTNNSSGTISVLGGTVDATTITNNGTFNFTGGVLNVDTFNGDLANTGGTLGPGHSSGTTTINGDYFQDASSTLLIEIEGLIPRTEYDVINVTGTLDGVLDFDLDYSRLVLSDSFDILGADVINGTFASITDQQINAKWIWELDYNLDPSGADILTARVTTVPIPEPTAPLLALLAIIAAPLRVRCG